MFKIFHINSLCQSCRGGMNILQLRINKRREKTFAFSFYGVFESVFRDIFIMSAVQYGDQRRRKEAMDLMVNYSTDICTRSLN